MHQDVSRTPRMGLWTLQTLMDGVYGSLFLSRMSAYRIRYFTNITPVSMGGVDHWVSECLDANGYKRGLGPAH